MTEEELWQWEEQLLEREARLARLSKDLAARAAFTASEIANERALLSAARAEDWGDPNVWVVGNDVKDELLELLASSNCQYKRYSRPAQDSCGNPIPGVELIIAVKGILR
jgi:hypothetical protein